MADGEEFVLDLESNPHPKMRDAAVRHRRLARLAPGEPLLGLRYLTYLEAMADATGCSLEDLDAWVARHDSFDLSTIAAKPSTPVGVPVRRRT